MKRSALWQRIALARFQKQGGCCALCGKQLVLANYQKGDRGAWNAHHIDGNPICDALTNCAVVCVNDPENCHLTIAHGGDYANGDLAPRSAYVLNVPAEEPDFVEELRRAAARLWRKLA